MLLLLFDVCGCCSRSHGVVTMGMDLVFKSNASSAVKTRDLCLSASHGRSDPTRKPRCHIQGNYLHKLNV
jgi:hypothetical protein